MRSKSVFQTVKVKKSELTEEQIKVLAAAYPANIEANAAKKMTKLIATEILTTEKTYLDNLTFLVEVITLRFLYPLPTFF